MNDTLLTLSLAALGALALLSLWPFNLKTRQRFWGLYVPLLAIPIYFAYDAMLPIESKFTPQYQLVMALVLFVLIHTLVKWMIRWYLDFKPIADSEWGANLTGKFFQLAAAAPIAAGIWVFFL